ncbi:YkgJ family cysteine cluster protein [Xylanibacillus composti]|uniref:YkgJ family cysteine cluster protein n=1 Tax=Xylanibacillus composti TaxID=1572762 RepID=UPI001BCACAE9|nr:YkgJ family cysteine cluster protein [Xylanibacillus composti]
MAVDRLYEHEEPTAAEQLLHAYQRLLEVVDEEIATIEQQTQLAPSCRKGCAHCCYYPIVITPLEAKLIIAYVDVLPERDKERVAGHLQQYFRQYRSQLRELREQSYEEADDKRLYKSLHLPCPMLDTQSGSCLAYAVRPIPCRTYLNYSDPRVCGDELLPKESFSYAFLGEYYMQALHEYIQALLMDGEDDETLGIVYPDDSLEMEPLPLLLEKWLLSARG